jgi:beta-lactam-binding protein with PASTA domain
MERLRRSAATWMLEFATVVLVSGSIVACEQVPVPPLSTAPATAVAPVSTETPTGRGSLTTGSPTAAGPVEPLSSGSPTAIGNTSSKPTVSKTDAMKQGVPNGLVGKSVEAAQADLSAAGILFTVSFRETEDAGVGVVLEVDPVGGTVLSEGQSVVLLVGKLKEPVGPTVPTDLVNKPVNAAQADLSAKGIPYTVTYRETEDAGLGVVLEVDPVGGTVLSQGQSVVLLVGKLKEPVGPTVPSDLVNKPVEAAQADLSAAGILFTVSFRETEDAGVGVVLEVDPVGGTVLSEGQSVVLLVGKLKEPVGPIVPTDLVNKPVNAAQADLSAKGIPYTVTYRETEDAGVGVVLEVDPVGGTVIKDGQGIVLLVGKAKDGSPANSTYGWGLSQKPLRVVAPAEFRRWTLPT